VATLVIALEPGNVPTSIHYNPEISHSSYPYYHYYSFTRSLIGKLNHEA
jgi:hypothetical protein